MEDIDNGIIPVEAGAPWAGSLGTGVPLSSAGPSIARVPGEAG